MGEENYYKDAIDTLIYVGKCVRREYNMESFEHIPLDVAKDLFEHRNIAKFRVHTINWTFATENGVKNFSKVHKNVYIMTLDELIKWQISYFEIAEDIFKIERIIN